MADIKLVRIDFRLIHGQVVTQWSRLSGADRIVIANDALAADDFMGDIYRMAAPQGIKVDILSIEDFCNGWKADRLGSGRLLVLFKGAADALAAYQGGFECEDVQIGGLGGGDGRVAAPCGVTFSAKDVEALRSLVSSGVNVHVQVVPSSTDTSLEKAIQGLGL